MVKKKKKSACQCRRCGRWGFNPWGSGRSPGEGNDNPLQYCCLKNPMDRGAWGTAVHGVEKELDMTEHARTHRAGEVGKLETVCPIYSAQKPSPGWTENCDYLPTGTQVPFIRSYMYLLHIY